MDLRGRFSSRKHGDGDGDNRGRSRKQQHHHQGQSSHHHHRADEEKNDGLDASAFHPLSPQSSSAAAAAGGSGSGLSKQISKSLSRHRSGRADEHLDERRGLAQKLNIFRPNSANASRNSSTNTSSSSLLSLTEQSHGATAAAAGGSGGDFDAHQNPYFVAAAPPQNAPVSRGSEQYHGSCGNLPLSPLSEVPPPPPGGSPDPRPPSHPTDRARRDGFPVYPDQSYAVLQNQVHPVLRHPPPALRTRSSYPSHYHLSSISTESMWNRDSSQSPRTVGNTPISSPGLFSSHSSHSSASFPLGESHLHPTHLQQPKETHFVEVDRDMLTGNKLINEYEILDELGRGEHGKVKLGRDLRTGQKVAIKIVQRYSKRRRLGKLGNPEDKVKKEVAILKKARHPNVVSLLEVIDDPNRQKVYIVLEYVGNGEIIWRTKGLKEIVAVEKERLAREMRGIPESPSFIEESQQFVRRSHLRRQRRQAASKKRKQKLGSPSTPPHVPAWSLEHGDISDDDGGGGDGAGYPAPPQPNMHDAARRIPSPGPGVVLTSSSTEAERNMTDPVLAAMEGSMYGAYASDLHFERRGSTTSSAFYSSSDSDWLSDDDDMGYVPVLTMSEARCAFRDAVLGMEYLHYQGIVHRDIKPANLLVTGSHQVKISDFGVSYLGRPIRDGDEEQVSERDAKELDDGRELSKTVGTPAFYAPELCYTGDEFEGATAGSVPKITGAIDVWSLGVTLYGMIFGRLPFVADDEFGLFQIIVKHPVLIPSQRLKAVEPVSPPSSSALTPTHRHPPVMNSNKRLEDELAYEPIDEKLRDLLSRLLEKDPTKRVTLKEVKQHPWVVDGIADPKMWAEQTDPGFQSKGKKIEVSNEEVTRAVTKMPFIERVRSNVAKWGGSFFGRGKDGRRRAPSYAAGASGGGGEGGRGGTGGGDMAQSPSSSSSVTLGRDLIRELRRSSLRGDEELPHAQRRESEHPLSQSVVPSPDAPAGSNRDYFGSAGEAYHQQSQDCDRDRSRPELPERSTSTLSNAESAKTIRPRAKSSDIRMTVTSPKPGAAAAPAGGEPRMSSSPGGGSGSSIGGLFGGAGRKLVRSLQRSESRRERSPASSSDHGSVDSDAHGSPSVAVTTASAGGHVQSAETLRDSALGATTTTSPRPAGSGTPSLLSQPSTPSPVTRHRHSVSQQCMPELPPDPFRHLHHHDLQHQRPTTIEGNWRPQQQQHCGSPRHGSVKNPHHHAGGAMSGHDALSRNSSFRTNLSVDQLEMAERPDLCKNPPERPMTSPPSAVTISSSSADDSTSGMSYCASHPSIPSVVSGASSFSSEALHSAAHGTAAGSSAADRDKQGSHEDVPPLLRTGDTVTARNAAAAGSCAGDEQAHDDDDKYDCDDENEGDLSDEGIVLGKKKDKKRATYTPASSTTTTTTIS